VASPYAVGLDPATLCGIGWRLQAWTEANVHPVLVIRHGNLVYERYFTGSDEVQGNSIGTIAFDASTKHDQRSTTKCIVSLLLNVSSVDITPSRLDSIRVAVSGFQHPSLPREPLTIL